VKKINETLNRISDLDPIIEGLYAFIKESDGRLEDKIACLNMLSDVHLLRLHFSIANRVEFVKSSIGKVTTLVCSQPNGRGLEYLQTCITNIIQMRFKQVEPELARLNSFFFMKSEQSIWRRFGNVLSGRQSFLSLKDAIPQWEIAYEMILKLVVIDLLFDDENKIKEDICSDSQNVNVLDYIECIKIHNSIRLEVSNIKKQVVEVILDYADDSDSLASIDNSKLVLLEHMCSLLDIDVTNITSVFMAKMGQVG
jgi:hypothetical protein